MFDVKITVRVVVGGTRSGHNPRTVQAIAQFRIFGAARGENRGDGRYVLEGPNDPRLPQFGTGAHRWHWDSTHEDRIILETRDHHS